MAMKDVTRQDVLAAIKEFDDIGREAFLKKYKRGKATGYILQHNGKSYDSKAILGAAHEHHGLGPLEKFSGGEDAAVKYLRRLGFRVPKSRLNWKWDELILACELASKHDWKWLDQKHPEVVELSELLQMLPIYPLDERPVDFRSPGSVEAKLQNISTARTDYGKKKSHGGSLDPLVLKAFLDDPEKMQAAADAIRAGLKSGELQEDYAALPDLDDPDNEDSGTPEGRLLLRKHFYRERDRKKRQQKIDQHKKANGGKVFCETCGFDFGAVYGSHGEGYIECHHIVPLSKSGSTTTYLKDLILICSNCHRMIHRKSPWLTPDELRGLLNGSK